MGAASGKPTVVSMFIVDACIRVCMCAHKPILCIATSCMHVCIAWTQQTLIWVPGSHCTCLVLVSLSMLVFPVFCLAWMMLTVFIFIEALWEVDGEWADSNKTTAYLIVEIAYGLSFISMVVLGYINRRCVYWFEYWALMYMRMALYQRERERMTDCVCVEIKQSIQCRWMYSIYSCLQHRMHVYTYTCVN